MRTTLRYITVFIVAAAMLRTGSVAFATDDRDDNDAQQLVGSWFGTITATDPPGLEPFKDLFTVGGDGTVIESRRLYVPATPFGPLMETPGHGAWIPLGHRQFRIKFLFLLQDFPGGVHVGDDNIEIVVRVSRDGNTFTGTFMSQVRDAATNTVPLFTATGTVQATRIRAN